MGVPVPPVPPANVLGRIGPVRLAKMSPLETCSNFRSHFACQRVIRAREIRCMGVRVLESDMRSLARANEEAQPNKRDGRFARGLKQDVYLVDYVEA
jgi:hypothetical protein